MTDAPSVALETAFRAWYARLVRFAFLLGASEPDDVVQEAFIRAAGRLDRSRSEGEQYNYLRTTCRNIVAKRLRRRRIEEVPVATLPESAAPGGDDQFPDLLEALGGLSQRQREVIVLRFWEGLDESQIALTLGIANGSVKVHAHRAMEHMRRSLR